MHELFHKDVMRVNDWLDRHAEMYGKVALYIPEIVVLSALVLSLTMTAG